LQAIAALQAQSSQRSTIARLATTTPAIDVDRQSRNEFSASAPPLPMAFETALRLVPGRITDDAERERLAHERAYQQDAARLRAWEARRIALLDEQLAGLDAAAKFTRRIEAAEQLVAEGELQFARRLLTKAIMEKPGDLPLSNRALTLASALEAQMRPIELAFASDDQTVVSVVGEKLLGKFVNTGMKLPPGNYTVVGRRRGFREVVMPLHVRHEISTPTVVVICAQVAPP
jgi:hypothetical protein